LAPGQSTTQPIKSPYGWHVIRLLERRTSSAPPLAEIRAQLVANLQHEKYEAFLAKAK
jgi:peptidyl-prolyl cis-trans isomerase C